MLTSALEAEILKLQGSYIKSLDSKNMPKWLGCFSNQDNASYHCISVENCEGNMELSLMLDDNHNRLKDRVIYVDEIWKGTFQDYRTRHFTQCLDITPSDIGENYYEMLTNFHILYTPDDTRSTEVLVSGVYEDVVDTNPSSPVFLHKKAILDTTVLPRYLVYPV
ncbi:MAG: aromatic-ring-hydroxylating dioxygenase subunit beta [Pseudomonadota bacterium]|nr:aromatic-ring-hydroxylating dioxygenase subunit beta [Pseudomonadota bacterium]